VATRDEAAAIVAVQAQTRSPSIARCCRNWRWSRGTGPRPARWPALTSTLAH